MSLHLQKKLRKISWQPTVAARGGPTPLPVGPANRHGLRQLRGRRGAMVKCRRVQLRLSGSVGAEGNAESQPATHYI